MKDYRDSKIEEKLINLKKIIDNFNSINDEYGKQIDTIVLERTKFEKIADVDLINSKCKKLKVVKGSKLSHELRVREKYTIEKGKEMLNNSYVLLRDAYMLLRDALQFQTFDDLKKPFKDIDTLEAERLNAIGKLLENMKKYIDHMAEFGIIDANGLSIMCDYKRISKMYHDLYNLDDDNQWIKILKYRLYDFIDNKKFVEDMEKYVSSKRFHDAYIVFEK